MYATVVGCIGTCGLLVKLTLLTMVYYLNTVFNGNDFNICYLVNVSKYVSLVFPAVCNFNLANLKSSAGVNNSFVMVTVTNTTILARVRNVISSRANDVVTTCTMPTITFTIVTCCKFFVTEGRRLAAGWYFGL